MCFYPFSWMVTILFSLFAVSLKRFLRNCVDCTRAFINQIYKCVECGYVWVKLAAQRDSFSVINRPNMYYNSSILISCIKIKTFQQAKIFCLNYFLTRVHLQWRSHSSAIAYCVWFLFILAAGIFLKLLQDQTDVSWRHWGYGAT